MSAQSHQEGHHEEQEKTREPFREDRWREEVQKLEERLVEERREKIMLEQEKEQTRLENDRVQKEKERDRGKALTLSDLCLAPSILDHVSSYSGSADYNSLKTVHKVHKVTENSVIIKSELIIANMQNTSDVHVFNVNANISPTN